MQEFNVHRKVETSGSYCKNLSFKLHDVYSVVFLACATVKLKPDGEIFSENKYANFNRIMMQLALNKLVLVKFLSLFPK